jgi:hypothetical protein
VRGFAPPCSSATLAAFTAASARQEEHVVPSKPRFVPLAQRVRQLYPHADPAPLITGGLVRVGGVVVSNPRARIPRGAAVTVLAAAAFEGTGWREPEAIECPFPGRRGAVEHLLHLRRAPGADRERDR